MELFLPRIRSLRWIFLGLSARDVCRQIAIADQGVEDLVSVDVECIGKARPLFGCPLITYNVIHLGLSARDVCRQFAIADQGA